MCNRSRGTEIAFGHVGGPRYPAAHARMSSVANTVWPALRTAAAAFCPPLEVAAEEPGHLLVLLRDPGNRLELRLRYRSERGLFLRTYFLIVEADISGEGPEEPGELILRRRRLAWRRSKPQEARRWEERLAPPEFAALVRRLQVESLTLNWQPEGERWRLRLKTLSGSVTVTFFPPLSTPNPLHRTEAEACLGLIEEVRRAVEAR